MASRGQNLEELFDVVDSQDRVLRQAPRRVVHANGWRHRAVHVLVFNSCGEAFVQRRSLHKDMHPGLWDSSCSGHLDAGEAYDEAARREFKEELGVAALGLHRLLRLEACEQTGQEFVWIYRARHEGPFHLNPGEIEEGRWIAPAQLDQEMAASPGDFSPCFRLVWRAVRAS